MVPGATFPDYELPDHTSTPRRLSQLQGEDPLILTLARGHYCPKEHQQHLELAAFYPKIAVAYTQIVTIATDDHHTLQEFRASVGAQWTFLSDPERMVQRDLDIQEYTDPENNPMIPHTLVLKPGLVIHRIYNGYWFWGRPSVVDLWHDLREVSSEIRPDWDLSSAWTARGLGRGRPARPSTGGISGVAKNRPRSEGRRQPRSLILTGLHTWKPFACRQPTLAFATGVGPAHRYAAPSSAARSLYHQLLRGTAEGRQTNAERLARLWLMRAGLQTYNS